jgi:hypothetical protein
MSITTSSSSVPYAMSSSQSSTAATTSASGTGCCTQTAGCMCPACQALCSPVRPRFFAGQVLTEVDLMALEHYAMNAHRMHNRYLHGAGVVWGLDLVCDSCGDGIVVCPGYALDPCGRDLVVPSTQQVDVNAMISACLAAEQSNAQPCDPPLPPAPKGCDTSEEWCLTLSYSEVPMRPVTPLSTSSTTSTSATSCTCGNGNGNGNGSSSGCGCGGGSATPAAGWSCTCGQGGSRSTQACGCNSYVTAANLPPGCEPTRVVESFQFGVCRCDGACCSASSVLDGTFPTQAAKCVQAISKVLTNRLNKTQQQVMMTAALGTVSNAETTRQGVCELYSGVLALYQQNPCRVTCQLPSDFQLIDCSPQDTQETDTAYETRLVNGTQLLLALVAAYLRDCLCQALNPPAPDGCDDRIVLGCFTYSGGKVTQICNLECRTYAGSFVSRRYWLPIGPLVLWALGTLCCLPLTGLDSPVIKGTGTARLLERIDPSGEIRKVIMQDDFALPKRWPTQVREALNKLPSAVRERLTPSARAVNLAALQGAQTGDAQRTLTDAGVKVQTVELSSPDAVPLSWQGAIGIVEPGTTVRQYIYQGRVVGYGPATEPES